MERINFINGKAKLDRCYYCHESKAVIKKSQEYRQNIYCVGMSGGESPEVDWERDRHCFVITEKAHKADRAAEQAGYEQMNDMAEFMDKELSLAQPTNNTGDKQ